MDSNGFERASLIAGQSAVARAWRFAITWFHDAASESAAAHVTRRVRDAIATVPAIQRVRLTGVVVLTATLTQYGLLQLVPPVAQPHAPWLRLDIAVAGLVLIVAAGPIARAWPASSMCGLVARVRRLRTHV
jgi:hypothetical protein